MALQSQSLRNSNIRSSDSLAKFKKKSTRRLIGMVALVLALGGVSVYLVRNRDVFGGFGPRSAKAEPTLVTGTGSGAAVAPKRDALPTTPLPAPKPEPTVLEMGGRARPGGPSASKPSTPPLDLPLSTPSSKPSLTLRPGATADTPAPNSDSAAAGTGSTTLGSGPTAPAGSLRPPTTQPDAASPSPSASAPETSGLPSEIVAARAQAEKAMADKRLVEARAMFNRVLIDPRLGEKDREGIRKSMMEINKELVFSGTAYPNDPMVETYKVEKGDALVKIARSTGALTESGFIQRVNNVSPNALRIGQPLKIVKGPFHAVVSKSAFRMDIYAGPTPSPGSIGSSGLGGGAEPGWVYIRSFNVGLGENGKTPLGGFTVRDGSKMINPPWKNPKTGESFASNDPKNPIGHRWVGLSGLDESTQSFLGYGIHATIDPTSIGKEMSMGCVRMQEEDVDIVYDMLMPRVSVVKIMP